MLVQATLYHGQDAVRVHDAIHVAQTIEALILDAVYGLDGF